MMGFDPFSAALIGGAIGLISSGGDVGKALEGAALGGLGAAALGPAATGTGTALGEALGIPGGLSSAATGAIVGGIGGAVIGGDLKSAVTGAALGGLGGALTPAANTPGSSSQYSLSNAYNHAASGPQLPNFTSSIGPDSQYSLMNVYNPAASRGGLGLLSGATPPPSALENFIKSGSLVKNAKRAYSLYNVAGKLLKPPPRFPQTVSGLTQPQQPQQPRRGGFNRAFGNQQLAVVAANRMYKNGGLATLKRRI